MMRFAERQAEIADKIVGEVGGGRKSLFEGGAHILRPGGHVGDHAGGGSKRDAERVGGVEHAFLVLLHVLAIGKRKTFQHDQQPVQRADDPARLGTYQLGGIGIALLRHDRGSGGKGIGQGDKAEPVGTPDHHFLCKAGHVNRTDCGRRQEFQRKVTVGDGIHRIRHWPVEAEKLRRHLAVGRKAGAGKRGGAKRRFIETCARIGKTATIAAEHLDIGHQVKAEGHGLRCLQMGEPRHQRVGMFFGAAQQHGLQAGQRLVHGIDQLANPEPEIGRHLIIARACRMQPTRRLADQLGKPRLDVHMDVFQRGREDEVSGSNLGTDGVQPAMNGFAVGLGDDAAGRQHAGMRA